MSGPFDVDPLEGIRDVYEAYKILSTDSKADIGFVIEHLDKVFSDDSAIAGRESKELESIHNGLKAYRKLIKWLPASALNFLIERLEQVFGLKDMSASQQISEVSSVNETIAAVGDDTQLIVIKVETDEVTPTMSTGSIVIPTSPFTFTEKHFETRTSDVWSSIRDQGQTPEAASSNFVLRSGCSTPNEVISASNVGNNDRALGRMTRHIPHKATSSHSHEKSEVGKLNERQQATSSSSMEFEKKGYDCLYCDKKDFSSQARLNRHIALCTMPRLFVCKYCKKSFKTLGNLKSHEIIHSDVKPFNCVHCQKSFSQLAHLTRHLRTHSGEKPYKCRHCPKSFNQSDHLARHERTHTGEKPYECKYCQRKFTQKGQLKKHEKTLACRKGLPISSQF